MKILDGKKLAEEILENVRKRIKKDNLKLGLAVVLVGDNLISKVYIRQKEKACARAGIVFRLFKFPAGISEQKLKVGIQEIGRDPDNSGIIIQLPLPKNLNVQNVLNSIPLEKDADVLSEISFGRFAQKRSPILPPVVEGVARLFKKYKIKPKGKNVVIVGAGRLVGYPLAIWFLQENATVCVLNKYSKDVLSFTQKADILVTGVGKPGLIKGNMVKRGAVVVDCGTSVKNGKLTGDVDFKSVSKKASYITPVPGGVGPMTVAMLLWNLVEMNKK